MADPRLTPFGLRGALIHDDVLPPSPITFAVRWRYGFCRTEQFRDKTPQGSVYGCAPISTAMAADRLVDGGD